MDWLLLEVAKKRQITALEVMEVEIGQSLRHVYLTEVGLNFDTRNEMQVFNAQTLVIVYGERILCYVFFKFVSELSECGEQRVLQKLLCLFGHDLTAKHAGLFYMEGYFETQQLDLYHQAILHRLLAIKPEAVSLVSL